MAGNGFGVLERVREAALGPCLQPAGERGVGAWMDLIAEVSAAMSVLAAARDAAVVRLAAIEEVVTDDGVVGEQVNGLGTVCVDAAAMVATAAGVSTRFGQDLVEAAVLRVVRVPALHAAMVDGVLDEYRARCLGGELAGLPPELARAIVDAVGVEFGSRSGPALRRRAREILSRLAPELVRERIRRARSSAGLRRWSGEAGTQCWAGVFPSERSARAWAAVDALARKYRAEGLYETLEQARAYALLDLVDGRTTVETVLHVTVSADALSEARGTEPCGCGHAACGTTSSSTPGDDTEGADQDGGADVGDAGVSGTAPGATGSGSSASSSSSFAAGAPSGCLSPASARPSPPTSPPASSTVANPSGSAGPGDAFVRESDGLPGCHGGERFVAVLLPGSEFMAWVPVAVLPQHEATARWVCDPGTGALLDVGDTLAGEGYRPGRALRRLVRRRDRRCRFPGCAVPARQCDLDHVVPWPAGPTAAFNLMCLCRRHHRIKQRWRWRVRIDPDAIVEWTDPSGRRVRTYPADQLRTGQVQVTDVEAPTAEDIEEQREIQALNALYDELTGTEPLDPHEDHHERARHDIHDPHCDDPDRRHGRSEYRAGDEPDQDSTEADEESAGRSALEAALARRVAELAKAMQPGPAAALAVPTDRPRSLGNAFDQNRIPRPSRPPGPGQRPSRHHRDSQHWSDWSCDPRRCGYDVYGSCDHHDRGGSLPHHSTDGSDRLSPSPFDVSDLRARHRHLKIRYRPSKRHRRRAAYLAYLAAGGPPF